MVADLWGLKLPSLLCEATWTAGTDGGTRLTSVLRVALLHVTQSLDQHLHWNILVVLEQMLLGAIPSKID